MARKRRPPVPGVLWRLFRNRARPLSDTILSLLPPPPPSPELCLCHGRRCLRCTADTKSFLVRPDDPSDYRKLLAKCFVVVSENAPSISSFIPHSHRAQNQIVKMTIELMLRGRQPANSNVLCSGYDRRKCSSPIVELLSGASWCLLLSRVGEDFMVYLLRNTSIFLLAPRGKHHQVGGPPINALCFEMLKRSSKFDHQHSPLHKCGVQKRKRADVDDLTAEKQDCHSSYSTKAPIGCASSLGLTGVKSSMQLVKHHENENYDIGVSEVPKSTRTGTPRFGKRSRPFSWQRRRCKKQKQLTFEENNQNMDKNTVPTNTECLHASFECDNISLSYHEKLQMPWQCSCCLILQSLPTVPKRTEIKRQSIFYKPESSFSVLPRKRIHQ